MQKLLSTPHHSGKPGRGLTLIELMVVVSLLGLLTLLAGPPMAEFIGMQRLRGIATQLATDMQYARSEAISRNQFVGMAWRNEAGEDNTCYTAFVSASQPASAAAGLSPTACNCNQPVGSVCTGDMREVRTVQVPRSNSVQLHLYYEQPQWLSFDPIAGNVNAHSANTAEENDVAEFCVWVTRSPRGRLRVDIKKSGRSVVCTPDGSVPGVPACVSTQRTCNIAPS
jgi:type IV fimbrial biogenesis protein FimT